MDRKLGGARGLGGAEAPFLTDPTADSRRSDGTFGYEFAFPLEVVVRCPFDSSHLGHNFSTVHTEAISGGSLLVSLYYGNRLLIFG